MINYVCQMYLNFNTAKLKHPIAVELLISIAALLLSFLVFTPVYDDYGYFLTAMASGQFSDFPFIDLHYLGMVGVNFIYKMLYRLAPSFNWLGAGWLFFTFAGLYLGLRVLRRVIFAGVADYRLILIAQFFFTVFYFENFTVLSHTRFALIFCGISLVRLVFSEEISKKSIFFYSAVFILGLLHRPESGLGMLALACGGFLIYRFALLHFIKRSFIPVAAVTVLFGYFTYDRMHTDIFVRKIEPEIEYKLMDKRIVPLVQQKTETDSVKYLAAVSGMWFDPRVLTPEYIRTLLLPGIDWSKKHFLSIFHHVVSFYLRYAFIPAVFFCLLLLAGICFSERTILFRIILFEVFVFVLVLALDFNGKLVAGRHFLSIELVALIISVRYFFIPGITAQGKFTRTFMLSVVAVFMVSGVYFLKIKAENTQYHREIVCFETTMQNTERAFSGRIVANTLSNVYLLNHAFSVWNKNYTGNTYVMYDMFSFSLIPEYVTYLNKLCGCDAMDPKAFFRFMQSKNALYMADENRYELTARYMNAVHHINLQFAPQHNKPVPDCILQTEYANFDLRTVSVK